MSLQDELEEAGEPSQESKARFEQLCDVFGDKVRWVTRNGSDEVVMWAAISA